MRSVNQKKALTENRAHSSSDYDTDGDILMSPEPDQEDSVDFSGGSGNIGVRLPQDRNVYRAPLDLPS